jgi:DNA-binding NarL/FixJ family response regulator
VVAARPDVTVVAFPWTMTAGASRKDSTSVSTLDHMLSGRRGISPVMIGRTTALSKLARLVNKASCEGDDDLPAVALVAGEAGVGKTRLLRELVSSIPAETTVLVAQAEPGSLGRPLDIVRAMLGDFPTDLVDARAMAVDAVTARLGDSRSLVIFEDLHWADSDSVSVLEQLAATPLPELTLIATYRPDDLTSRLPGGEMVVRLERRRHVHQVQLERLDHREVAAFLAAVYGRPLGTAVVDALRNRTGGNPFFLEEILVAAGDVEPEALAEQPLPWTLAELVSRHLDGLSGDQRRIVEAAAVLGPRAPFDVLAVLSNRSEEQLIADLRGLVNRGLLVEEGDDEFSFRHELVRDAVEDQLLGRERRRLHERALEALRQSSTDLADLARHAAGAGRYDEMVGLAREGVGHYLDIGATHQALRLAVAALAEAPDDLDLLNGATRAAWLIGAHDEAWGHAARLLALTEARGGERRAAAVRLAARVAHERNDIDDMWQLVGELERLAGALSSGDELAATMAAIAQIDMLHDRTAEAIGWAERAIGEAEPAGAKAVRVQAMIERATAMSEVPEHRADGIAALTDAVAEAEHIEDWVLLARALHNLSNVVHGDERRAYLERMRDAGRRAGFDNMVAANYHIRLAEMAACAGDASAVWEHVSRVGTHVEGRAGDWALALQVKLLLEVDRVDEAEALLAAWRRRTQPGPDDKHRLSSQHLMLAGRRRDRVAAVQRLTEVLEESWCLDCHEEVVAGVDDAIAAGIDPGEVLTAFESVTSPQLPKDYAAAARALIACARADHAEVIAQLGTGSEGVPTNLEAPLLATLHLTLARALAAQGRTSEARQQATTARSLLERWPGWRRDAVDALVQRLDAAAATDGELTRREREVAALLAEGLSNSELARRLYISPRTAAVHVSNILTKLGMSSRAEVAAWAVRNGLTAA